MRGPQLRRLHFDSLDQAGQAARSLLDSGYRAQGQWTLGQICRHLRLVQDPSIDGYPGWMSLFAFLRPALRWYLLPKLFSQDSPRGIRTASAFVPPEKVDDAQEVELFEQSIARFLSHSGYFHPHPGFGSMSKQQLEALHAAHAAHHLRFLEPVQP